VTSDPIEKENDSTEHGKVTLPETASACAPSCACGIPDSKGDTKIKMAICLVVIVAVAGILVL
jgi:hypothetical protein